MKLLGIYDNLGESIDRYTIVFDDTFNSQGHLICLALSSNPESPQGFSQWCSCMLGDHLGKKITLNDLPENVYKHALMRIKGD